MKKSLAELEADIVFTYPYRGKVLRFAATWGLFSPARVDDGTHLLLSHLELAQGARILDVGCGYGAIGICLAATDPDAQVHMVDKDFVAVAYAKKNIQQNNLPNCQAYLSNLCREVPPSPFFDVIVSNVPAKAEREMYDLFLAQSLALLKPGGQLWLVYISGLKEFFKKNIQATFGNYDKIKQNNSYTLSMARKPLP